MDRKEGKGRGERKGAVRGRKGEGREGKLEEGGERRGVLWSPKNP